VPKGADDSRLKQFRDAGVTPDLPPLEGGQYLVEAFQRMRFATPSPMGGLVAREWSEVEAFALASQAVTEPWEKEVLFEMSWAYVEERTAASDPLRIAPVDRV
jgi:hypothetical protein